MLSSASTTSSELSKRKLPTRVGRPHRRAQTNHACARRKHRPTRDRRESSVEQRWPGSGHFFRLRPGLRQIRGNRRSSRRPRAFSIRAHAERHQRPLFRVVPASRAGQRMAWRPRHRTHSHGPTAMEQPPTSRARNGWLSRVSKAPALGGRQGGTVYLATSMPLRMVLILVGLFVACIAIASGPPCGLRVILRPSNGSVPGHSLHVGRLLIMLAAPHLTLQPRTFHNLSKPTHRFLNRLPLTQHDLDRHHFSPATTSEDFLRF